MRILMDRAIPRGKNRVFRHTILMIKITRKLGGADAKVVGIQEEGYGVGGRRNIPGKRSSGLVQSFHG
jgi:hypothetical protein